MELGGVRLHTRVRRDEEDPIDVGPAPERVLDRCVVAHAAIDAGNFARPNGDQRRLEQERERGRRDDRVEHGREALRRLERLPREAEAALVRRRAFGADGIDLAAHVRDDNGELGGARTFARWNEPLEKRTHLLPGRDAARVREGAEAHVEHVAEIAELGPQLLEERHRGSLAPIVEVRGEERAVHRSRTRGDDAAHVELEPLLRRGIEELGKGAGRERALGDGTGEDQRVGHDHSVAIVGSGQANARAHRARPMWFGETHFPCV